MGSEHRSTRPHGHNEDFAEASLDEPEHAEAPRHDAFPSLVSVTPAAAVTDPDQVAMSREYLQNTVDRTSTSTSSSLDEDPGRELSPSSDQLRGDAGHYQYPGPLTANLLHQHLHEAGQPYSKSNPPSTQTSSSSLHAMSGVERQRSLQSLQRIPSPVSTSSSTRGRGPSHSKSSSTSNMSSSRLSNLNHPVYPDQSFAALSPARPGPAPRTRSSHAAHSFASIDSSSSSTQAKDRPDPTIVARTVGNTPISSPAILSPAGTLPPASASTAAAHSPGGSPLWQPPKPKETHEADKFVDVYTGKKIINNYEIERELGRGEHGKVKLGRDLNSGTKVAIKIVLRYSKRRRLGKLGAPEDRVKKEVAILKKARHQHVVGLLEVIDDPSMNKVYIVLEYVEGGEIKWRKLGVRDVLSIAHIRFEQERLGKPVVPDVRAEERYSARLAERRAKNNAKRAEHGALREMNFSNESGQHTDDEFVTDVGDLSGAISRQASQLNHPYRAFSHDEPVPLAESPLSGSAHGSWVNDLRPERKFSIAMSAVSHMSSEHPFDEPDDQHSYVPALTFDECRRAVRDVLLGLEFLHCLGIIHRDIKPANLLVAKDGEIKISDFGVSYFGRPTSGEDPDSQVSETDATALDDPRELARSVGTPAFWAPELCYEDASQFEEKDGPTITGALDLWSLGITLYCMVYARLPFYANGEMGLTEVICKDEVFLPKTRLVPVEMGSFEPMANGQEPRALDAGKRSDYELEFEEVPNSVRDLIRKLLIKDPVRRINIRDAKQHEWIVEGLRDPAHWLHQTNPAKETKTEILDVDDKEMSHAVVKLNIIERLVSSVSKAFNSSIGRTTRHRGTSNVTSASVSSDLLVSPSTSSGSTVGKHDRDGDHRNKSLKGDEFAHALRASREGANHPLAQSQTASPEESEMSSYFPETTIVPKAASAEMKPVPDQERRPRGPERAISAVSTADSVRTIRPPKYMNRGTVLETSLEGDVPNLLESASQSLGAIFSGASRRIGGLRSRERRPLDDSRSPSASRKSSESDAHGEPSVAVSTASATGDFEAPEALRDSTPTSEYEPSPASSEFPSASRRESLFQVPASSQAAFEHAQELNQRRLVQEHHEEAEKAEQAASRPESYSVNYECPPSPDDEVFANNFASQTLRQSPMQTLPSQSTIASSVGDYNSSTSQSMSNPSLGIISGASSPPEFMSPPKEHQHPGSTALPEFMRTADTITDKRRPVAVAGAALEDQPYEDAGDEEEYDDDDEDEGIVMGGMKNH